MKNAITLAAAFCLASCASLATPERCEQAAAGLASAEQIAVVLINRGVEPERAHKLADAVVTGQLLLAAACASAVPRAQP